ncbi:M56 family metallopeptidase [Pseudoflavonifractor phocaeensis]|uniref:M56 family metallopeptidase n=1 Tax=Pseudoflavonifractor phocaeensis TaxID=1870988 RepID=UPI001F37575A|nr:M56 family metallopeptidase [Pseudoflavonifractor phocaeensis]MCF2661607.1 M56 family metallopeptidase [Pseudoflavonifractor phocaeensis]
MNLQLLTQWAITSALLILAVLAVRFCTRGRLSCINRYALWAVVLARLLVPFQLSFLPSPDANATDLVPTMPGVLERPLTPDTAMGYALISPDHFEGSGFHIQEDGTVLSDEPSWYPVLDQETGSIKVYFGGFTVEDTILAVWGWGAVLAGGVILLSNLCFWLRLTRSRRGISVQHVNLRIYTTKCILSPCLFGLFRPAMYLPHETLEDEQTLRHVLAHELTHWAHRDHAWAVLRCLALALHWYNPLVWLAAALSKRDGELACDEGAVARLGEDQRIPYGRTLVDMVARRALRPGDLLSCSTAMAQGRKTVQQRVALLVRKPETKKTALFAALAAVALAAVFTFAGGEAGEAPGNEYPQFRDQAASAQAIRVGMPPISSLAYPEPITDDDLLQQARELLLQARDLLNLPEDLDLDKAPFDSYTITLSGTGFSESYYFSMQNGGTYVVTPAGIGAEEYTAIAVLEGSVPASLMSLAKEQQERNRAASTQQEPEPEGVRPGETVNSADLDPIRAAVDRVLASELAAQNRWLADFSGAQYTGVQLTGFRLLSSYPDLLQAGTVKLYCLDYGLSIDDLSRAGWAGGAYADENGLFHPYGPTLHLLTVEREGEVQSWSTVLWEFLLEPGQEGVDIVDEDYVRDVVVSNLRDLLDPVVPAPADSPEQAVRAYGEALARYYLSLGEGHPQYVTYARLAGYTVE